MLIYFAGPDVFRPDHAVWAGYVRGLCANHGWTALIPGDGASSPAAIYEENTAAIRRSDVVVVNGNAFRGCEPDSGTAFEAGYAVARDKCVIVYVDRPTPLLDRVKDGWGPLSETSELDGSLVMRDRDGNLVENWGLPLNLMLAEAGDVVVGGVAVALKHLADKVELKI